MTEGRKRRWRRAMWAVLALTALFAGAYSHLTDPTRLRAKALEALQALPIDGVDVAEVTFSPWNGLQISDLVIDPQEGNALHRRAEAVPASPLLHVGLARVDCSFVGLLFGRIHPTAIELQHVGAAIVYSPAGAPGEAVSEPTAAEAPSVRNWLSWDPRRLPRLTVRQVDLQLLVVERGRAQLIQRLLLHAEGRATPAGYELRVDRRPSGPEPLGALRWRADRRELETSLDWADLNTIARLVPAQVAEALKLFELTGRARLDRLVFRAGVTAGERAPAAPQDDAPLRIAAAEVRLADLHCALPVEADGAQALSAAGGQRAADRFLQITNATATVTYRHGDPQAAEEFAVKLAGHLRGAPATFSLRTKADLIQRLWAPPGAAPAKNSRAAGLSLDDVHEAELSVDGLELPTVETYPAFIHSPRLGGPIRSVLRDYRPRGKVNVRLHVLPSGTVSADGTPLTGAARLAGEIEACGASCRYVHFPYRFEDVWGRLRLSDGRVLLDDLCGRHGGSRVCASGVVNNSRRWTGFDLEFRGQEVALDGELYAALPDEQKQLWQRAAPLGLCDVVTTVRRPEGSAETGPLPSDVRVDARLLNGSLSLGHGKRLDHAYGWLTVHGGVVQVRDLHGHQGEAGVRLDGSVRLVDGDMQTDLSVELADLPVEHTAALALGSGSAGPQMRFVGHADVWGRVCGSERGGERHEDLAVHIKDGTLAGRDPARRWVVTDGCVRVQDGLRQLVSLAARQGEARLEASGTLPTGERATQPLALELYVTTPAVEELYPQFIPDNWTRLADTLGLSGPADVRVRLQPGAAGPAPVEQLADIELHGGRMKPRPMPLDLRDVSAELSFAPGRFRVLAASARWGADGYIEVKQSRDGTWQSGNAEAEFDLTAQKLVFGPELSAGMPKRFTRLLDKLVIRGGFDLVLPSVHVSGGEQHTWRLAGRLPLTDAALRIGLDLSALTGELTGDCTIRPDGDVDLQAEFAVVRAQLAGRPIAHWEGRLLHRPGERWVRLEHLHGQLCDGVARGSLRVDPQTTDYELSLELYDVAAAQLLPPPKAKPERPRRGRIDGEVWLRGREGEAGSRRGGGNVRVSGASFIQTPVLAAVLQQRAGSAPDDTVDQARIRFLWDGVEIRLERIDIRSRNLRLVGEGTWNLTNDAVAMTLWAARPERWPRLAVISDLLESAGQELVQYRVEGTLAAPRVTPEPLHRLNDALRRLLGEE